jgi:cytosine/adenosine deaminase-related metal-dependent hydrolase
MLLRVQGLYASDVCNTLVNAAIRGPGFAVPLSRMSIRRLLVAAALTLPVAFASFAQTLPVVFKDVNVVSMTSPKVAKKMTVVVQNGTIQEIFPNGKRALPERATVIEGAGRYLMPGLADMHAHIPPKDSFGGVTQDVLYLYLANGITTVRGMLGANGHLDLQAMQKRGTLASPNLYVAGPMFGGPTINSVQDSIDRVKLQKMEGWDLLKVHEGLSLTEYDAMAKAAREAGLRFGGHVPEEVGVMHAIDMGQETFEHMAGFLEYVGGDKGPIDAKKLDTLLKKTRAAKVWVVPTSALWEAVYGAVPLDTMKSYPELKYLPAATIDLWAKTHEKRLAQVPASASKVMLDNRVRLFRALHKGGVKILLGTDSPQEFSVPGYSLHREMQWMKRAGMTPYEILRTGTVHAGEYFSKQDSFGTIEPGRRADLLLLEKNPLDDIANVQGISGVMVRGKWYARTDLDAGLAAIQVKHQPKEEDVEEEN